MTIAKQLDHLISAIYETAINPSLWKKTLCLSGQYVGASHGLWITTNKNIALSTVACIAQETWFSSHDENSHTNKTIDTDKLLNMFPDTPINCAFRFSDTDQNFIDHSTSTANRKFVTLYSNILLP